MFYDEKLKRFRDVGEIDDDENRDDQDVIPNGGAVSIRMTMMDSTQRDLVRASRSGATPDDLNTINNAHWGK